MVPGRSPAPRPGFPRAAARSSLHVVTRTPTTRVRDIGSRREFFLARGFAPLLPLAGGVRMYSVVLLMALSGGAEAPDCHKHSCHGCSGGCSGYVETCHGGCSGSCHGG